METKKTKKANIEGLRGIFFECGLIVGLFFMIVAFSWSSDGAGSILSDFDKGKVRIEDDIPITNPEDTPPPPPEVAPLNIADELQIVDNAMDITSVTLFNPEDNKTPVFETVYVKPKEVVKEELFEEVFDIHVVQERPTTADGKDANSFSGWVSSKIVYPQVALDNGIQGKVFLRFKIGSDGFITNIEVLRSIHPLLDKEAIRVVSSSPKWNPGKQNGKPVSVMFTIPVNFVITN